MLIDLKKAKIDPKLVDEIMGRAEELMNDKIHLDRKWNMEKFSFSVDFTDSIWDHEPITDLEWNYVLNRMEYLLDLCYAYDLTDNEAYFEKLKVILFSRIAHPFQGRTLDTGFRLTLISKIIYDYEMKFTADEMEKIRDYVRAQIAFLEANYTDENTLSNWGFIIRTGIEFSNRILKLGHRSYTEELLDMLNLQVLDDGMHWEQSSLYHVHILLLVKNLINYTDIDRDLLEGYVAKMLNASACISDKHYNGIALCDSDYQNYRGIFGFQEEYNGEIIFEEQLEYNCGYVPELKTNDTKFLKDSNVSRIEDDKVFLVSTNGPLGGSHGHLCPTNIFLKYEGKEVFINPGRGTYEQNEIRFNLKGLHGHNTIFCEDDIHSPCVDSWRNIEYVTDKKFNQIEVGCLTNVNMTFKSKKHFYNRDVIIVDQEVFVVDHVDNNGKLISNFISSDGSQPFNVLMGEVSTFDTQISRRYSLYEPAFGYKVTNQDMNIVHVGKEKATITHTEITTIIECENFTIVYRKDEPMNNRSVNKFGDMVLYGKINVIKNGKVVARVII